MPGTPAPMIRRPVPAAAHGVDMELVVGYVLLGGVVLSMALIASGLTWRWLLTGHLGVDYSIAGRDLFDFAAREVHAVASDDLRPRRLINLGFVCLLLTPYARVLASVIYFAVAARNWKYTVFTGVVLCVLTYSLFLA